jgi:hypothetical protein
MVANIQAGKRTTSIQLVVQNMNNDELIALN